MLEATLSANGSTGDFPLQARGAGVSLFASGTWGSGTLTVQVRKSDGTFYNIPDAALTADGTVYVDIPSAALVRATLTGATTPSLTVIMV